MSAKVEISRTRASRRRAETSERAAGWPDEKLVRECLRGSDEAWSALVDKYKNLIYSIPIKYRLSSDDATDIFQSVCLELLSELPKLRNAKALPKWIIQITAHKCFRHKQQAMRITPVGLEEELPEQIAPAQAEHVLREAEEEQDLRRALSDLTPRCRRLIHMLFYEEPARPYQTIASELGLAPGSIGFIRQRCLDKLRKRLQQVGFS
ncbi:MAG TPA: sigma-70 family RNA polymerase sigma factor [Candidatus Acidoferrum sp.]|nr:sigma-70 family RNA polymerase sigma factor [Candidatus Acidoferrum sp.]